MATEIKLTDVVAALGVLSAFMTAVIGLIGYRWSKQVVEAKDAQIAGLKEQISSLKDLSPDAVKKQSQATIEALRDELTNVRTELASTRAKFKERSVKLNEATEQLRISQGIPKSLFDISDYELELRRLSSFVMRSPWRPREFPEGEDFGYEFYLQAIAFYRRDPTFVRDTVSGATEWIMDYLFYPLLACIASAPRLRSKANEVFQDFLEEIEAQGLLSDELPLYRDLLRMANEGVPFTELQQYSTFQSLMLHENGRAGYPYGRK